MKRIVLVLLMLFITGSVVFGITGKNLRKDPDQDLVRRAAARISATSATLQG